MYKLYKVIAYAKLLTKKSDSFGYITYVFQNLDNSTIYDKYIMCVRFPNWQHSSIELEEKGFLEYRSVKAGEDKWYDSGHDKYIPYKYTDCHFIKFVPEKQKEDFEYKI